MQVHTDPSVDTTDTDPKRDWSYVAEGGATIVFSYVGPFHPVFNGKVLRLRKSLRLPSAKPSYPHLSTDEEPDEPSVAFQKTVTSKLVPNDHLPDLQTVKVSSQWLQCLVDVAEPYRPIERTAKDGIDTSKSRAVLATDLIGGRGWAVEIKPKWGFLPCPTHLSSSTRPIKTRYCRFCMHSHLKGRALSMEGGYCPLDLFSGSDPRVRKALGRLWEAWVTSRGKVNNLRVFVDGKVVDPGDPSSSSRLSAQFPHSALDTPVLSNLLPPFIDAVLPLLMDTPLLAILSHHQRTLDSLDIEGLSQLWSGIHLDLPFGKKEPDPSLAEWGDFVHMYSSGGESSLRYHILAYLLSATFKDCSVILRLFQDGAGATKNTITAIDLDPKSTIRLADWKALDLQIVWRFMAIAAEREPCIDAGITDSRS